MKNIELVIKEKNLIKTGDIVGIACSGGRDSMALLHFFNKIKDSVGISIIAINIDHCLRENSASESAFVSKYCEKNNIKILSYSVDVKKICANKKLSVEQGAREARYKIFRTLLNNKTVTKIALGHHLQDQTETILQNIFRGAGLKGASGMDYIKDSVFIRPFLQTSRSEIQAYIELNDVPYVDDESNFVNDYSRNYIRNMIIPLIRNRWQNADASIASFGEICSQDDAYIQSQIPTNSTIYFDGNAKILINYLVAPLSISTRIITNALSNINAIKDIERKHILAICDFALNAKNGDKISLPNRLYAIKEYNHLLLSNKLWSSSKTSFEFKKGRLDITNFGIIEIFVTRKFDMGTYTHIVDYNKIPKTAVWRYRENGDTFEKFSGGTKSLNDYFIDKKIPRRLRDLTPVLADANEILVVAGVEISKKVKIDENSKTAYGINVAKFL